MNQEDRRLIHIFISMAFDELMQGFWSVPVLILNRQIICFDLGQYFRREVLLFSVR
jgi:hypothetical protein